MTPGWTVAVRATGSMSMMERRWREVSMTTPVPMELPAMDVPPPRGTTGTPCAAQTRTAATQSSTVSGTTTAVGTRR